MEDCREIMQKPQKKGDDANCLLKEQKQASLQTNGIQKALTIVSKTDDYNKSNNLEHVET
jgi:hypothetical protein